MDDGLSKICCAVIHMPETKGQPTPPVISVELAEAELAVAQVEADVTTELAPRRRAFVREFLLDQNATQAAIRAGYSPATAGDIAGQLKTIPGIARAIKVGLADLAQRLDITQEKVLAEMHTLANASIEHYFIDDAGQVRIADGAPPNAMAAVKSIKRKVKRFDGKQGEPGRTEYDVEIQLWDKPGSLKLMGRHVNLFADRVEHSGPNGGPIPLTGVRSVIVDPKDPGANE